MVAIAPFSSPEADVFVGVLFSAIGLTLSLRYLLYLYGFFIFNNKDAKDKIITQNKDGTFSLNEKKVYPTIFSAYYNNNNDDAFKNNYLIMKSRSTHKEKIKIINMGKYYVVQKGGFKIYPVLYMLLSFSISFFAFYSYMISI